MENVNSGVGILAQPMKADVPIPPLMDWPFRPLGLWDMYRFYGEALFHVTKMITFLATFKDRHAEKLETADGTPISLRVAIDASGVTSLRKHFEETPFGPYLQSLGMPISASIFNEMEDVLNSPAPIDGLRIGEKAAALLDILERELSVCFLIRLTPKEADLFNDKAPFGEKVVASFPSSAADIEQAARCLALHRNTAAVFHSMRAVEVGLKTLHQALDASLPGKPYPSWNDYICKAKKGLEAKRNAGSLGEGEEQFYSAAISLIESFKLSWRNPTMHVEMTYSEEQAEDVFNAARSLMRHLAERLNE